MSVKIEGMDAVVEKMRELAAMMDPKSRASPLLPALRKAGQVVQKDAKARVRKDTGTLRDNIIVSRVKGARKGGATEAVEVTIRYKAKKYSNRAYNRRTGRAWQEYQDLGPLFYARFLEFGTSKMPAYPFLRPAFDANASSLPNIVRDELAASIEKQITKLRNK